MRRRNTTTIKDRPAETFTGEVETYIGENSCWNPGQKASRTECVTDAMLETALQEFIKPVAIPKFTIDQVATRPS